MAFLRGDGVWCLETKGEGGIVIILLRSFFGDDGLFFAIYGKVSSRVPVTYAR